VELWCQLGGSRCCCCGSLLLVALGWFLPLVGWVLFFLAVVFRLLLSSRLCSGVENVSLPLCAAVPVFLLLCWNSSGVEGVFSSLRWVAVLVSLLPLPLRVAVFVFLLLCSNNSGVESVSLSLRGMAVLVFLLLCSNNSGVESVSLSLRGMAVLVSLLLVSGTCDRDIVTPFQYRV
jgi:hypothetical protein